MSGGVPVITGVGVVAPGGVGREAFWDLLVSGRTATRRISLFDPAEFRSQVAAEVDFDPRRHGFTNAQVERMDRFTQFAVVALREAVADSGLDLSEHDPYRVGVVVGSAVGATMSLDREYCTVSHTGTLEQVDFDRAVPHLYDYFVPSSLVAELAERTGARGWSCLVSNGCTSGIDAVGQAADLVRRGVLDVVITGAAEAPISPITVACFDAIRATSPENDDPEHASRPFDATRRGFILGEGGAIFVIEREDHARARGAQGYATVAGFAGACNAHTMTGLRPDGAEMARCIVDSLKKSGLSPDSIGYINAHGSGTKQNDRHETAACKLALGDGAYKIPMSSIKSMVGHSLGAIGAIEIAASVLTIRDGIVPPTANLHHPDPLCDLDNVPLQAREARVDAVLSVASGFGGFQSAMVLVGDPDRPSGTRR